MKNFQHTLFIVLFFVVAQSNAADCATPGEYVMQFLKDSTTLNRGSQDWKSDLDSDTIETVYARTHLTMYAGLAARGYHESHKSSNMHKSENAVSARFSIKRNSGDTVEVASTVIATEIERAETQEDKKRLKMLAATKNGKREEQADYTTKCTHTHKWHFDEKSQKLEKKLIAECLSRMPKVLFEEKINS